MSERLPIPAARIADVAALAHVCPRTVQKYRDGLHVLDVVEIAITKAARELPADAQLEIPSVAGQQPIHAGDVFGPEYTNKVRPLSRPLVIGVPLSPERVAQLNYAAGAGDDPAGSPDVSREPKSPLERKPAGISSEVAAKTSCQPPASNRAVGVLGMWRRHDPR